MIYKYRQNNTGGSWQGKYLTVYVEANSEKEADFIASELKEVNIYFDGCEKNMDCECCGDRWSRTYGYDFDNIGEAVNDELNSKYSDWGLDILFVPLSGRNVILKGKE